MFFPLLLVIVGLHVVKMDPGTCASGQTPLPSPPHSVPLPPPPLLGNTLRIAEKRTGYLRSRGHEVMLLDCLVYLAGQLLEVYIYMIVRHPHICTDISVDAELMGDRHQKARSQQVTSRR